MKRASLMIIILLTCWIATNLYSQNSNPLDDMLSNTDQKKDKTIKSTESDSLVNDIIRVNYSKKNAQLAMTMSAILPGAGQFYVDKSSIAAYIFPVIELAIIGSIVYYNKQGDDKVKDYKKYINEEITVDINGYSYTGSRYRRDFQTAVEDTLKRIHSADIYDGVFFSLDASNSQHFYEDIGKYNKYVFGWADWYLTYAELPTIGQPILVPDPHPVFIFDFMNPTDPRFNGPDNKWQYNVPLAGPSNQYDRPSSPLRAEYIKMRQAAEDKYRVANYLSFGIAVNHIVSAIDAVRKTNNLNRLYLSQNRVKMQYYASIKDGYITPMLGLNLAF